LAFFKRKLAELADRFKKAEDQDEKKKIMAAQSKIQSKVTKLSQTYSDDYYDDPENFSDEVVKEGKFEYKMKSERE